MVYLKIYYIKNFTYNIVKYYNNFYNKSFLALKNMTIIYFFVIN